MPIDWAMISATVIGPILAVQAQKWVERSREKRSRKEYIFQMLMSTRAARMSPDHVRALNMIDLTFYGLKAFGGGLRSSKNQKVLNAWKEYIDHLSQDTSGHSETVLTQMYETRDGLFFSLLERMSEALGYSFDRVILKKHGYSPSGFGTIENQQEEFRQRMLTLLAGNSTLKMEITNLPASAETSPTQPN